MFCLFFLLFICIMIIYIYFLVLFVSFPNYVREVMSCYIRRVPGEKRNQGRQGGLIATTRDETFWGG